MRSQTARAVAFKTASRDLLPVHFLRTRNSDGDACYFFIRASKANFLRLTAKKKKEHLDISQFGEILASGFGWKPSKEVIDKLWREHQVKVPENL